MENGKFTRIAAKTQEIEKKKDGIRNLRTTGGKLTFAIDGHPKVMYDQPLVQMFQADGTPGLRFAGVGAAPRQSGSLGGGKPSAFSKLYADPKNMSQDDMKQLVVEMVPEAPNVQKVELTRRALEKQRLMNSLGMNSKVTPASTPVKAAATPGRRNSAS